MSYYFSKVIQDGFEDAIDKTTRKLNDEGFGILTTIDIQSTLKKKLDVDLPRYTILGACNPPFAYQAVRSEPLIGLMLPCNVIVKEQEDGRTEVAAVDPLASMQAVGNPELEQIATEVGDKLKRVIDGL